MSTQDKQPISIEARNREVHELNYVDARLGSAQKKAIPSKQQGRELARKIQENIEAYQNEINAQSRPNLQAQ